MVIVNNIDQFINFNRGRLVGIEDVGRVWGNRPPKLGSAVLRWQGDHYHKIWAGIETDHTIVRKFHGDQDYIWSLCKNEIDFFPADWIRSYKWEIRNQTELIRQGSGYVFKNIASPTVSNATSVLAFHGTPNPHEVKDPIIVDNWK
jgi:hypothetical protein